MLSKNLNILLIESDPADAEQIMSSLNETDSFDPEPIHIEWVRDFGDSLSLLDADIFDAVMIDLSLPGGSGLKAIEQLSKLHGEIPIVAVASCDEQNLISDSMRTGAQDFILKLSPGAACARRTLRYAIERKKAEVLMDELRLLQQRDTFIAMLAHDLRNPIIGCERILSLMLDEQLGAIPEEQKQLLSMMRSSHKGLLLMIANVLDCYRIESGKEVLDIRAVNLSAVVADCLLEMSAIAVSQNITIYHCLAADIFAHADNTAMHRVINNLLSNALKFTPSGGEIRIHLSEEDDKVLLNIEDTGKGIPAEELDNLFQRFFQCQKRDRGAGLGIGLNICKQLMDAQHGSISCSSEPGVGSIFVISLPRYAVPSHTRQVGAENLASAEISLRGTIFEDTLQSFNGALPE